MDDHPQNLPIKRMACSLDYKENYHFVHVTSMSNISNVLRMFYSSRKEGSLVMFSRVSAQVKSQTL